jgi:TIGR03009 family protein
MQNMRTILNRPICRVALAVLCWIPLFNLNTIRTAKAQAPIRQPAPNAGGRYTNAPASQPQMQAPGQTPGQTQMQPQAQAPAQQYQMQPAPPQQQVPAQQQKPAQPQIPGQPQLTTEQMMEQMGQNAVLAPPPEQAPAILAPDFVPLSPENDRMLKTVLGKWQNATQGIERYKCDFLRWQFDMTKISDPKVYHTAARGVVRYMAPDKGMFRVDELKFVRKDPRDPQADWQLHADPEQFGEYWICDGNSVYLYDRTQKKATKYTLPPAMQGKQVFNSPLPFFFGVDAQKIEQRFWVNPLPDAVVNEKPVHVLDVYPKTQADAVNYHHVRVYLDQSESLPVAIEVCMPNWTEEKPNREFFEFRNRNTNWNFLNKLKEMSIFQEEFIPKEPPAGWQVEVKPYEPEAPQPDPARVANPNPANQPGPR